MLGALLVVAAAGSVFGQGFQGGLRGSIKDAGGVIPGVEVTLTNESTNLKRSTVTNERGEYVFAAIDPGTYAVKATLQGYKSVDRGAIRIGTQQFLTLDLTMEVGSITENVTVTGQAPLIDTSNASTGTTLDSAALQTLPSPGRNAFMIGASVPTVVPSGDAQFNRQQDQTNSSLMSLGGGTRRGNNYTLDGVPITDMRNRMSAVPTTEGVDDLKVQVHTYDAEMGRTGGGVFNVTAKSGTNNFHGTGFFQTRPIWGQTNNYFSQIASDAAAAKGDSVTAAKLGKPNSPYYLGGGGVGGPIVKDRTFFWFSNEQYHDVQTRNSSARMPTTAERTGDFSGLVNSAGQQVVIYDPLTKLPFPGNVIPSNRINPVAAAMIVPAAAGHQRRQRREQLQPHVAHQEQFRDGDCAQDGAQVHRQGVVDRLLSLQPNQRAVPELLRHRGSERAEPLRRSARLHPAAPAAAAGVEQHLGAERQLGDVAALRHDALPGQQHAVDSVRSVDARVQLELSH